LFDPSGPLLDGHDAANPVRARAHQISPTTADHQQQLAAVSQSQRLDKLHLLVLSRKTPGFTHGGYDPSRQPAKSAYDGAHHGGGAAHLPEF
jgi:hypothetical protein